MHNTQLFCSQVNRILKGNHGKKIAIIENEFGEFCVEFNASCSHPSDSWLLLHTTMILLGLAAHLWSPWCFLLTPI